jgi:hypothetical protein
MEKDKDDATAEKKTAPAPGAPATLSASEPERRAARTPRADGRPLWPEETAPGERGDAPYGDSEPGKPKDRPGV